MLSFNSDTLIVAVKNHRASMLNDEMVVLNLDNEQYYVFNESATVIWSQLQQPICLDLLVNADNADEAELKAFLLDLVNAGLLMETDTSAIAREINLSLSAKPILTCMGGMKELVAMAGSAGGTGVGELDPGTEGVEDYSYTFQIDGSSNPSLRPTYNDKGVGDDQTGRPEDPGNPFSINS